MPKTEEPEKIAVLINEKTFGTLQAIDLVTSNAEEITGLGIAPRKEPPKKFPIAPPKGTSGIKFIKMPDNQTPDETERYVAYLLAAFAHGNRDIHCPVLEVTGFEILGFRNRRFAFPGYRLLQQKVSKLQRVIAEISEIEEDEDKAENILNLISEQLGPLCRDAFIKGLEVDAASMEPSQFFALTDYGKKTPSQPKPEPETKSTPESKTKPQSPTDQITYQNIGKLDRKVLEKTIKEIKNAEGETATYEYEQKANSYNISLPEQGSRIQLQLNTLAHQSHKATYSKATDLTAAALAKIAKGLGDIAWMNVGKLSKEMKVIIWQELQGTNIKIRDGISEYQPPEDLPPKETLKINVRPK